MSSFHKSPAICPHPLINPIQSGLHCDRYCLCGCIKPIFTLCQVCGIFPAKFMHSQHSRKITSQPLMFGELKVNAEVNMRIPNSRGPSPHNNLGPYHVPQSDKTSNCSISVKFLSIPSLINIAVMTDFIVVTFWVIFNINTVLKFYFNGTDLYTFGLQIQLLYFQASGVLINAFLKRRKLQQVWNLIQEVYNDRISVMENSSKTRVHGDFSKLRKMSYSLVGITCLVATVFAIYFMYFVFRWCFIDNDAAVEEIKGGYRGKINNLELLKMSPTCPFANGFLFLQKLSYVALIFYNLGFASLFSGFCAILCVLYGDIERGLKKVLKRTPISADKSTKLTIINATTKAEQLEGLRISHGKLCRICRLMGDCFGISVVIVCVSSLLSITCAIYSGTLRMGILNVNVTGDSFINDVFGYYSLSTMHGCIALFALMLMLVSGQIVQNATFKPAEIIAESSLLHLNTEERLQVSIFLQRVGTGYTGIVACNITKIGLSFLAAAATNVTTYILVILQFRFGVQPQVEADEQQHRQLHVS